MRKRLGRELVTVLGIVVILSGVVFFNGQVRRTGDYKRFETMRLAIEQEREQGGLDLLDWNLLRETKGVFSTGAKFSEDLLAHRDQQVSLIGFMVPLRQFREADKFMLLPVPIECYFCESPQMREVVLVRMGGEQKADMIREPVVISGKFELHEGAGQEFFYTINDAVWGMGKRGSSRTPRQVRPEEEAGTHLEEVEQIELLEPMPEIATPSGDAEGAS